MNVPDTRYAKAPDGTSIAFDSNRGDSQGNAFSYLVRRWHLRCGCEVPKEYRADLSNFDRTGYKGG